MSTSALVIGIAGGSGSGKSFVAKKLQEAFSSDSVKTGIISQDDFYKELDEEQQAAVRRNEYNFDLPTSVDLPALCSCISRLKRRENVQIPSYNFHNHKRTKHFTDVFGLDVVILEGLFVLSDERIRELLDIKLYINTSMDILLQRRLQRDKFSRSRMEDSILAQFYQHVKPSMETYIQPSVLFADIVLQEEWGRSEIDKVRIDALNKLSHMLPVSSQSAA